MKEIKTHIKINASAREIWEILTDLENFSAWNPFITEASGDVKEGTKLSVHIQPPGSNGMNFKPKVTRVQKEREFRWLGHLFIPGIFDGEHIFELDPIDEGTTHFIHREKFKGILVPLLWNNLHTKTRQGFENMNRALKDQAEESRNEDFTAI